MSNTATVTEQTYSRRVSDNPNDVLLSVEHDAEAVGGWNYTVVRDGGDVVGRFRSFDEAREALDALVEADAE